MVPYARIYVTSIYVCECHASNIFSFKCHGHIEKGKSKDPFQLPNILPFLYLRIIATFLLLSVLTISFLVGNKDFLSIV